MNAAWFRNLGLVAGILAGLTSKLAGQPEMAPGVFKAVYDIRNFGAVADGATKCTEAIRQAIAAAELKGGGTVYVPAGCFLTGPVRLESHITLFLDSGAVLKFSTNFDDYLPMVPSRWEGIEVTNFSPLIYAQNAEEIAIRGRGTLDGQGRAWWNYLAEAKTHRAGNRDKWQEEFARLNPHPLVAETYKTMEMGFLRPPFIQPNNCTNVLIEGVTVINSPFWTITPLYCENVMVQDVVIHNPTSPNTDGIDPDSCHKVRISNCDISVGDDCITIKSGRDADGRRVGRPADDYVISNCTMEHGHGGVTIGSEASGGVKNITVANCVFDGTDRGIRIKSTRGRGGVVEDVNFNNIVMRNIKEEAIVITSFYERSNPEPVSERTPLFQNIRISGITGDAKIAGAFTGLVEKPLKGISLTDVNLDTTTGITIVDAESFGLHNVTINTVRGPAVTADRTAGLELDGVRTTQGIEQTPLIDLRDVKNVFAHGCSIAPGMKEAIRVREASASQLIQEGNNFGSEKTEIVAAAGIK